MSDFVDRYMRLKKPEHFEHLASDAWREKIESFLRDNYGLEGGMNSENRRLLVDAHYQWRARELEGALSPESLAVLSERGVTPFDIIEAVRQRHARQMGGQKQRSPAMDIAARAFLQAEHDALDFQGAIALAKREIDEGDLPERKSPNDRTLRNWLNELIRWRVTTIAPAARGRPKRGKN